MKIEVFIRKHDRYFKLEKPNSEDEKYILLEFTGALNFFK